MRFMDLGPAELLLIVVAIVLVFGAGKIGEIGGALGKSVREFRSASRGDDEPPPAAPTPPAPMPDASAAPPTTTVVAPSPTVPDYRP